MSFSYNPYRHIEILTGDDGRTYLLCSSCGAEIALTSDYVSVAFWIMMDHVRDSHKRGPEDFEGWGVE